MINILLVSKEDNAFDDLKSGLKRSDEVELYQTDTSNTAFDMTSEEVIDLVVVDEHITDMTGLEFVENMVSVNPMINCAVVSSLSSKEFHEASEGLGILAQLSPRPDEKQAEILLQKLKVVLGLTQRPG